jgi:hypothetical protein
VSEVLVNLAAVAILIALGIGVLVVVNVWWGR